jgi:hypothetical protein
VPNIPQLTPEQNDDTKIYSTTYENETTWSFEFGIGSSKTTS